MPRLPKYSYLAAACCLGRREERARRRVEDSAELYIPMGKMNTPAKPIYDQIPHEKEGAIFPFMSLPGEIRNMIYIYFANLCTIVDSAFDTLWTAIYHMSTSEVDLKRLPNLVGSPGRYRSVVKHPLLQICRQIRREALVVFLQQMRVSFDYPFDIGEAPQMLKRIGPLGRANLSYLQLNVHISPVKHPSRGIFTRPSRQLKVEQNRHVKELLSTLETISELPHLRKLVVNLKLAVGTRDQDAIGTPSIDRPETTKAIETTTKLMSRAKTEVMFQLDFYYGRLFYRPTPGEKQAESDYIANLKARLPNTAIIRERNQNESFPEFLLGK